MISPWKPEFFDHSWITHQWILQNNWYWKLKVKEQKHSPSVLFMVRVQIWFLDKFCSKSIISIWKPDFFDDHTQDPSIQWISKKNISGFESQFCFREILFQVDDLTLKIRFLLWSEYSMPNEMVWNGFWIVMDFGFWNGFWIQVDETRQIPFSKWSTIVR